MKSVNSGSRGCGRTQSDLPGIYSHSGSFNANVLGPLKARKIPYLPRSTLKASFKDRHHQQMASVNETSIPPLTTNGTTVSPTRNYPSHNWEFLVAVLATAISVSILLALFAKCQVIRRYLASYRHTRLREPDAVSHSDSSGLEVEFDMGRGRMDPRCLPPVSEEDDDGFIEDNYIPASERARAERAAEEMDEDTEEELEEIEFSIT